MKIKVEELKRLLLDLRHFVNADIELTIKNKKPIDFELEHQLFDVTGIDNNSLVHSNVKKLTFYTDQVIVNCNLDGKE